MDQDLKHPIIPLLYGTRIISGKKHTLPITKEYILKEYSDIFNGIGILPGNEYDMKLKNDYKPVQHPPR